MSYGHHPDDVHYAQEPPMHPPSYALVAPFDPYPPTLGQARCYWCLISSALTFVYLDPVFARHLEDEADGLLGKSIIDFVHPDEQQSARRDLAEVLHSGNLDGTLTRMRFSRLSRVRRLLGYQGPAHHWPDAEKIAIDANYIAIDLVVNVAADGVLLCFIHAAVDLSPHDSDPHHKSEWSNWCGDRAFTADNASALWDGLSRSVSPSATMTRVFQIAANTHEHPHPLLFSWPPEPAHGHGPSAREFARLSDGVNIDSESIAASTAKTSCTRRFKVKEQAMTSQDAYRLVDSVFIPRGSIIFACHQVKQQRRTAMPAVTAAPATNAHQPPLHNMYMSQHQQHYLESPFSLPSMHSLGASAYQHLSAPQHIPSQPYPTWQAPPPPPPPQQQQQQQPSPADSPASYTWTPSVPSHYSQPSAPAQSQPPPAPSSSSSQPYSSQQPPSQPHLHAQPQTQPQQPPPSWSYAPEPESYRTSSPAQQSYYSTPAESPFTMDHDHGQASSTPALAATTTTVVAGAARVRRTSPGASRDGTANGRSGNPPAGVVQCSSCKATHSPEWRKGPSGKKDLCNACGLRYARSRAKKEGVPPQRRKRDPAKIAPMPKRAESETRRDSLDMAAYTLGESPNEYAPASQQVNGGGSTPSPPAYQPSSQVQMPGKEQRYYQPSPLAIAQPQTQAQAQTQLPPFHELPHTLSPSLAPSRPAF